MALRVLYETPFRFPSSTYWFNRALPSQRQRISDDLPAVMCITPIRRLVWFVWKQAPPVHIRWLSCLKLQIFSDVLAPCPCPDGNFPVIAQRDNSRGARTVDVSTGCSQEYIS